MYSRLSRLAQHIYLHVADLRWPAVISITVAHFFASWGLLWLVEAGELVSPRVFWYFYVTTGTTVGYGDYAPASEAGRLVTVLWVMPGGIAILTVVIGKVVQQFSQHWRKWMQGLGDYSHLEGHIVILGWQGDRTRRMVHHIRGDEGERRELLLATAKEIENPLPQEVKFVRGASLNAAELLQKAGVAKAAVIIVLGHDDNETLAAALGAGAVNRQAHLVAYFEQPEFAELLSSHCPKAECNVSLSIELMVRSAQDPGSSRLQQQLLSTLEGPTQFSLIVPDDAAPQAYGTLFDRLKHEHGATLLGVAPSGQGGELLLNAADDLQIQAGDQLFFMSPRRLLAADLHR